MDAVTEKLNALSDDISNRDEVGHDSALRDLHKAACRNAAAACDTYTGEKLEAAMKISTAITNFTALVNSD